MGEARAVNLRLNLSSESEDRPRGGESSLKDPRGRLKTSLGSSTVSMSTVKLSLLG